MTGSVDLRVGIDVGGTNADAVVLDVSDRVLAKAKTPHERLEAIVNTNFNEEQFTPQVTVAWLSFWAQVPFSKALSRINNIYFSKIIKLEQEKY